MRMLASRLTTQAKPLQVKRAISQVAHVQAPIKGLSVANKLQPGDPLTAVVLTNYVVENDRIVSRPGYVKVATGPDVAPIETLIPWYGNVDRLAAGCANKIIDALTGNTLLTGLHGNDWSSTAFANLGQVDYTVMCNGIDGVWSWNGNTAAGPDPGAVSVLSLSNTNPATCQVAPSDLAKFQNGMTVTIAGATGTGMTAANGAHVIGNVGVPANTFTLVGVSTASGSAPQTSGVTADAPPAQPFQKETIIAPTAEPWISPDQFQIVISHMNRLWFADNSSLAVFYLPVQQKSCVAATDLHVLPLNAYFKRGGSIRAMATWTVEGGVGTNDQLVIFTSNGEAAIFQGTDPDSPDTWGLTGIFRFDPPMSKHSVLNYGGDLYVLIPTGLVPMSTMLKAEADSLGVADANVVSLFRDAAVSYGDRAGWQAFMNPSTGRAMCNVPGGAPNKYGQLVRNMPQPIWSSWENVPSRCWCWLKPYLYFGDDKGNTYRMHRDFLSDAGNPITLDVMLAWSTFKSVGVKQFKFVVLYMITDGEPPRPQLDVMTDYDYVASTNRPDITYSGAGAAWDTATWNVDAWAQSVFEAKRIQQGVGGLGQVGAPRLIIRVKDCRFAVAGFDVLFETGAAIG